MIDRVDLCQAVCGCPPSRADNCLCSFFLLPAVSYREVSDGTQHQGCDYSHIEERPGNHPVLSSRSGRLGRPLDRLTDRTLGLLHGEGGKEQKPLSRTVIRTAGGELASRFSIRPSSSPDIFGRSTPHTQPTTHKHRGAAFLGPPGPITADGRRAQSSGGSRVGRVGREGCRGDSPCPFTLAEVGRRTPAVSRPQRPASANTPCEQTGWKGERARGCGASPLHPKAGAGNNIQHTETCPPWDTHRTPGGQSPDRDEHGDHTTVFDLRKFRDSRSVRPCEAVPTVTHLPANSQHYSLAMEPTRQSDAHSGAGMRKCYSGEWSRSRQPFALRSN